MDWKRIFGIGKDQAPPAEPVSDDDADRQLDAAMDWLDATTSEQLTRGFGEFASWRADLAAGMITFENAGGEKLDLSCQAVGTFNSEKQTWHWGWDHPSIPKERAGAAEAVRKFGELHGLDSFTVRQIPANEDDAWQFSALAGFLTGAEGIYRCPGNVEVYLALYPID